MEASSDWFKLYDPMLARNPNDPLINLRAGVLYYYLQDLHMGLEYLLKAWKSGRSAEAAYYLGRSFSQIGKEDEARWFWAQCLAADGRVGGWRARCARRLSASLWRR